MVEWQAIESSSSFSLDISVEVLSRDTRVSEGITVFGGSVLYDADPEDDVSNVVEYLTGGQLPPYYLAIAEENRVRGFSFTLDKYPPSYPLALMTW